MTDRITEDSWEVTKISHDYMAGGPDSVQLIVTSQTGIKDVRHLEEIGHAVGATPDLLQALLYARRFLREDHHDTVWVDSVIAKARGGR